MRKGRKKNVVIYLDPEVVKEAKELGLNISKICENVLKEYIRKLTGSNQKNEIENNSIGNRDCLVDGEGFEPSTSAMPTPRSYQADLPAHTYAQFFNIFWRCF